MAAACARWPEWAELEKQIRMLHAGTDFPELGVEETREKYVERNGLAAQLETLKRSWPDVRQRLTVQLFSSADVKRRLDAVGAPSEPEMIGITRQHLRDSATRALPIRRRFTVLDLAVRTGSLTQWLDALFGSGCLWDINGS